MTGADHIVEALVHYAKLQSHLEQAYPAVKQSGWQEMLLNAIATTAVSVHVSAVRAAAEKTGGD